MLRGHRRRRRAMHYYFICFWTPSGGRSGESDDSSANSKMDSTLLRPSMIVFSVVAAVLVAHHFRWRSKRQHIGCHTDAGREFEGVKTSARKRQLDEVGDPSLRRLGRFGDVDAVSAFF